LFTAPAFAGPYDVPAKIPDTGQTKCYDTAGAEIPCAGTGQDGESSINPMSFTSLSGGTMVQDNVTGLIWEVKENKDGTKDYSNPNDADNTYTWYDSNSATNGGYAGTAGNGTDTEDFIAALNAANFGGYSDWRLPSREELRSIVDYSIAYSSGEPTINKGYFPNTQRSYYWSSTTDARYADGAWDVSFDNGGDGYYNKSSSRYVRAVRSGQGN
jgi:hypothetical protein